MAELGYHLLAARGSNSQSKISTQGIDIKSFKDNYLWRLPVPEKIYLIEIETIRVKNDKLFILMTLAKKR